MCAARWLPIRIVLRFWRLEGGYIRDWAGTAPDASRRREWRVDGAVTTAVSFYRRTEGVFASAVVRRSARRRLGETKILDVNQTAAAGTTGQPTQRTSRLLHYMLDLSWWNGPLDSKCHFAEGGRKVSQEKRVTKDRFTLKAAAAGVCFVAVIGIFMCLLWLVCTVSFAVCGPGPIARLA